MATKVTAKPKAPPVKVAPAKAATQVAAKPGTKTVTKTVAKPATRFSPQEYKTPTLGTTQYVGSTLQYVDHKGTILPATSDPAYTPPAGTTTTPTTTTVTPPVKDPDNNPVIGSIIGTRRGSKSGFRIDLIADGKGGYTESADIADAGSQYGDATVIPGATGTNVAAPERTLAEDTFANTFALAFGKGEANQPYVKQLYALVAKYYKSGSTTDDSLNLALHDARTNNAIPDFTKRFDGLFTLQAKAQAGQAIQVPTIAEFIHAENAMGDVLRTAGMGDLATQGYIGQIIGQGKSVQDVASAITTSFNAIDGAPQDIKDTLAKQFPMLDRTTLAKSLLMGTDGAAEIQKKIDVATTATAASKQDMTLTDGQKQLLSTSGLSYTQQLQGLGNVNLAGSRGQELTDMYGKTVDGFGKDQAFQDQFQGLASAQRAKQQLIQREQGTFNGSSGTMGPSYGTPRSSFNNLTPGQI